VKGHGKQNPHLGHGFLLEKSVLVDRIQSHKGVESAELKYALCVRAGSGTAETIHIGADPRVTVTQFSVGIPCRIASKTGDISDLQLTKRERRFTCIGGFVLTMATIHRRVVLLMCSIDSFQMGGGVSVNMVEASECFKLVADHRVAETQSGDRV
jgi:hypothetical protein